MGSPLLAVKPRTVSVQTDGPAHKEQLRKLHDKTAQLKRQLHTATTANAGLRFRLHREHEVVMALQAQVANASASARNVSKSVCAGIPQHAQAGCASA